MHVNVRFLGITEGRPTGRPFGFAGIRIAGIHFDFPRAHMAESVEWDPRR